MITSSSRQRLVLQMVANERARQDAKWGAANLTNRSAADGLPVLVEEVGEVARAIVEHGDVSAELIQVAAVAVAMIEAALSKNEVGARENAVP